MANVEVIYHSVWGEGDSQRGKTRRRVVHRVSSLKSAKKFLAEESEVDGLRASTMGEDFGLVRVNGKLKYRFSYNLKLWDVNDEWKEVPVK